MIKKDIAAAIIVSLKAGKQTELKVLRYVLSEIKYAEIAKQKELSDEETISVISKEIKKRREAIELFKKGGRNDLVADEEMQINVIEKYLPKQLSTDELNQIIDEVISANPDQANLGILIGLVMTNVRGKADGSQVAKLVAQKLGTTS